MRPSFRNNVLLFSLVIFLAVGIRLYRLDEIPGEWFGDISNVHEYVQQILGGEWPFYFFQSNGPLYHYVIAPLLLLPYQGYLTYKLASVIVSLFGLISMMVLALEATSLPIALVTGVVGSFSFWFLVWSRLGNVQILIPLLTSLLGFSVLRYWRTKRDRYLVAGDLVASLGWYVYPQTFILPVLFFVLVIGTFVADGVLVKKIRSLFLLGLMAFVLTVPFISIVQQQRDNFTKGYIGQKIFSRTDGPLQTASKFLQNVSKTLQMLHLRGDTIFRINVEGEPHLDRVSGMFFLIGLFTLAVRKQWRIFTLTVVSMAFLILPSISPAIPEGEIPSSSRTIGIVPYVYFLVAVGMYSAYRLSDTLFRIFIGKAAWGGTVVLFSVILFSQMYANLNAYFVRYVRGLPDHNSAPGTFIARYIDEHVPVDTAVYFGSCCWGAWGQPEPKAVYYNLLQKRVDGGQRAVIGSCDDMTALPAVVIAAPNNRDVISRFESCFPRATRQFVTGPGQSTSFMTLKIPR